MPDWIRKRWKGGALLFPAICRGKGAPIHPAAGIDRRHAHNRRGNRRRSVSPAGRRAGAAQRVASLTDNGQSVSFQAYAAEAVPSSGLTESEMQALCATESCGSMKIPDKFKDMQARVFQDKVVEHFLPVSLSGTLGTPTSRPADAPSGRYQVNVMLVTDDLKAARNWASTSTGMR